MLRILLNAIVIIVCTIPASNGGDTKDDYDIDFGDKLFSLSVLTKPNSKFIMHHENIDLTDMKLFEDPNNGYVGLNLNWTFRGGIFQTVKGMLRMKVIIYKADDIPLVESETLSLKKGLVLRFKRVLTDIGCDGSDVDFDEVLINGRSWLSFRVPVLNTKSYSIAINESRYLRVNFSYHDNSGEESPDWLEDAFEMEKEVVSSLKLVEKISD